MTRAPLRWAGSKRKSISTLTALFPKHFTKYVEPFSGSACIAFHLNPPTICLGDLNPQLVEFYQHLRDEPKKLHSIYREFQANPATYYEVRALYNKASPSLERAAKFLYLNRHCFNGIYRVNSKGEFNVPWGGDKVGAPLSLDEVRAASVVLSGATIECADFECFIERHLSENALVYIDPPYARHEERVFREYHEKSFSTLDWDRLITTLRRIDDAGAHFLLSYAGDASLLEELRDWNAGFIDVTRNVGGFKSTRRKYREFIATNVREQG